MAQTRKGTVSIQSKAEALQITDLKTAITVLQGMGVEAKGKGIRNKDDAIRLIMEQLDRGHPGPPAARKSEPSRGLRRAIEEDSGNKDRLQQKYDAVRRFYSELPSSYQKDLNSVFPGITDEFTERSREIQKSECTILIAGETAAGKSSLVNLLLGGTDLLPTSQLGCTSTICELRTSTDGRREAIAYFRSLKDGGRKTKKPPVMFDLSTDQGVARLHAAVQDTDDDGESPYDRIEIVCPFPMLEEGMVIVDTPGIGGGGNMAKYAEKYLSKSYGFIYVINSANAGGVQKGRLQNFMRLVVNSAGDEGFNSDSTMFVCNRWDMIPERDREAVKVDTFDKLARFYPSVRRSQVHYMSIGEASKALQYDTVLPEYSNLMDMVERLLPNSLRSRLNTHYRWLSAVLKRSIYSLKVSKVMEAKSMDKIKDEYEQVRKQIARLEENSRESIGYLKMSITRETEIVERNIIAALQSRAVLEFLFEWRHNECPADDKKKVVGEALERIMTKVATAINKWDRDNNIVHGIKDKIVTIFKKDFELMEGQIAKLEGALLGGDTRIVQDLHKSIKKQAPVKQLWKKAKEGSIDEDSGSYRGIGGAVASVSSLKSGDKQLKKLFSDYKSRDPAKCVARMQDATKLFLNSISESKHMRDKLQMFFKRFTKGIDAIAKMIPDFLKADVQLLDILRGQMSDTESNLREVLPRMIHQSHFLLGQLDLFYVNHIMQFDYSLDDVNWDTQEAPVGSGSFADVYIGDIKSSSGRRSMPVALKVSRDPIKESTVTDILLEDRTLRDLDHENIIRYYGAMFRYRDKKRQKDMQWIMLMEVCKYTLKEKFVNPDVNNPGKLTPGSGSQLQAMLSMADFALQLCCGLRYLHDKGFVHRDLKLENILVNDNNEIKLTDVGLTKRKREIAFSIVGSPVYMAPEVLLQSQNYDHKADIYSLAIVLWEMWYGRDAADYIQEQLFGPLEKAIKDGLRPSLKLAQKPPDHWTRLIADSWAYDPDQRPPVDEHCNFFEAILKESRRK